MISGQLLPWVRMHACVFSLLDAESANQKELGTIPFLSLEFIINAT